MLVVPKCCSNTRNMNRKKAVGTFFPYVKIYLMHQGRNWKPLKTPVERESNYKTKDAVCALC